MLGLGGGLTGGAVLEEAAFTPASLGSTMVVWYKNNTDIADLSGTDGTDGNRLQWTDQSGGSRHAIQDTDANKPGLSDGGLDFEEDEANFMNIATGDGALNFSHPNPFTIILAMRRESTSSAHQIIGADADEFIGFVAGNDKLKLRAGGSNVIIEQATADLWTHSEDYIITITKDSSGNLLTYKNSDFYTEKDGGTSTLTGTDLTPLNILGAQTTGSSGKNFDGKMYELIICDTVLSSDDRGNTITYLKDKFSIS